MYSQYLSGPSMGPQMGPPGGGSWIGPQATRPLLPLYQPRPQGMVSQQGRGGIMGALGAIGDFTGFNDMDGLEKMYMLASVGGGVYDALERRGQRKEEQRRYEQALEESRRHRASMGANWNRAMGGP